MPPPGPSATPRLPATRGAAAPRTPASPACIPKIRVGVAWEPKDLRGHWGVHDRTMEGLLWQRGLPGCFRSVVKATDNAFLLGVQTGLGDARDSCCVVMLCRSGRHRSVGMAYQLEVWAEAFGAATRVLHLERANWRRNFCTDCYACRRTDAKAQRILGELQALL